VFQKKTRRVKKFFKGLSKVILFRINAAGQVAKMHDATNNGSHKIFLLVQRGKSEQTIGVQSYLGQVGL